MKLSIVTTLYKSSLYVNEFYERISTEAKKITDDYEIIFVDDGSPDDSLQKAIALHQQDSKVVVIELSRNFGHHKAIMAGLSHTSGDYTFLIDVDLEEEPELLGRFWQELEKNKKIDVITAKQIVKRTTTFFSDFSSKAFYKVFNHLSNTSIPENEFVARLMKQTFVKSLLKYREVNIFLPGLWNHVGFKIHFIDAEKKTNHASSYTFLKKVILSVDAITSFSSKPLLYVFWSGFFIFMLAVLFIVFILLKKLINPNISIGWTSLIASIWATSGIIMLSIGILGIYLGKVMEEVKNRPLTLIKTIFKGD